MGLLYEIWVMDTGLDETTYIVRLTEQEREQVVQLLEKVQEAKGIRFKVHTCSPLSFAATVQVIETIA